MDIGEDCLNFGERPILPTKKLLNLKIKDKPKERYQDKVEKGLIEKMRQSIETGEARAAGLSKTLVKV